MSKNKNAARTQQSNKSAPKPPMKAPNTLGTKGATVKKEVDVEIDDDEDDEDDEEVEVSVGGEKKEKKSQKAKLLGKAILIRKNVERMLERTENVPRLHALMGQLLSAAKGVAEGVEELPADWKRKAGERPSKAFNPGEIVTMPEAHRAKYDGLLEDGDFDELTVVKQVGKKVIVRSPSGVKTMLPAFHVTNGK